MSKKQNYIIVVGGVVFICAIIVFGVFRFILFPDTEAELNKQILNFLYYVIPTTIAAGFLIARILNIEEKKELKIATDLANEYARENKKLYEANVKQLAKVEEWLATQEKRQDENETEHEEMRKDIERIEKKLDKHLDNHKQTA